MEGPELSKVTAEDPVPLEWGQHTVPPLRVYIKGEEEIKKEKEERRGEKERNGKKAGDRLSGKIRQRESMRGRCRVPWTGHGKRREGQGLPMPAPHSGTDGSAQPGWAPGLPSSDLLVDPEAGEGQPQKMLLR